MTENEFLRLTVGTVVSGRGGRLFVIYDDDNMGTAHRGREHSVYAAQSIDEGTCAFIRIDKENFQFWNMEGTMKKEDLHNFLYGEKSL